MPQGVVPLSRRRLLVGAGLSALAGVGALTLRGHPVVAHPGTVAADHPIIRAVTTWEGGYAALVGASDDAVAVHALHVGRDRRVTIGADLGISWPPGFQPWGIAAVAGELWITGSTATLFEVVTVDNRIDILPPELREIAGDGDPDLPNDIFDLEVWHYLPAVVAIDGQEAKPVDIPVPDQIRWGSATGIVTDGSRTVAVAMDGCPDPDASVVTRSHLAVSTDGGRTWRQQLLDRSLGEGYATTLVRTADRLVAISVDGEGARTVRSGVFGSELDLGRVDVTDDAGPVAAAVPDGEDGVKILTYSDGGITIETYRQLQASRATVVAEGDCGCATDNLVAVHGEDGTWIAVTDDGGQLETSD